MADLVDDTVPVLGTIAEEFRDGLELDAVGHRRGAVGIDVVDLRRIDTGLFGGGGHGAEAAVAVFRRGGDVIGVARHAVAEDFGIDLGAACLGVFVFLDHDDAGAFAHDEAVAILIIGARGGGRDRR